jgi:hypothetical protein
MRALALLLIAFAVVPRTEAAGRALISAYPPIVPAQFGVPVRCDLGTVQYPGFTVHLAQKDELLRADGQPPWVINTLQVLNEGHIAIGGDLIFNSETRANGRRFDVAGKIFVAEMFHSTAGLKEGEAAPITARLAPNEIVIWDEATAMTRNVSLAKIWRNETVEPDEGYYPAHAYESGTFLPGFSPAPGRPQALLHLVKPGTSEVEPVAVLTDAPVPPESAVSCAYGERASFRLGALKYPDVTVVFVSRTEANPDPLKTGTQYRFSAFGKSSPTRFDFDTSNLANGRSFTVDGVNYFAEMFFTTAAGPVRGDGNSVVNIPLAPGQLIIWNEAAARRHNQRIVAAFEEGNARMTHNGAFAAGTLAGIGGFMSTTFLGSKGDPLNGWCEGPELDAPLQVLKDAAVVYPAKYAGSGYVGHVDGYLYVERDGTVSQARTTDGSDYAFEEPSAQAIRAMRFTIPMRDGHPVRVFLGYTWSIAEPNCDTMSVRFN